MYISGYPIVWVRIRTLLGRTLSSTGTNVMLVGCQSRALPLPHGNGTTGTVLANGQ